MRAPERAADGFLPARDARSRRAAARGGGASRRHQPERRSLCGRVGGGSHRSELHRLRGEGRRRGARRRARRERAVPGHRGSRAALTALLRRARGARQGRRLRRLLEAAPRSPLGARSRLPRAVRAGVGGRDEAAPARARPDGRDACAPRPHALGAHARGLPPHEHVDRDTPAHAPSRAPPRGNPLERGAPRRAAREAGRLRGDDGRAPAPVDREGHRLHAPRGRARPGEPHRPFPDLRAAPRDGARRAADPRPRPLRARRGEPERPRLVARVARSTGAARRGRRHGVGVAPAPALPATQPLGRDTSRPNNGRRALGSTTSSR